MKKRILSLLLVVLLLCGMGSAVLAAEDEAAAAADTLNALDLFRGVAVAEDGTPVYDLSRAPNRQEAVTILVRLLGRESEALAGQWETPFTDVDSWAVPYVGYAYANGLTNGIAATLFGGGQPVTAAQFITFVLRALGYSEAAGDFKWDESWQLSDQLGITDGRYTAQSNSGFTRGDAAIVSESALRAQLKGQEKTLLQSLVAFGAVNELDAVWQGLLPADTVDIAVLLSGPGEGAVLAELTGEKLLEAFPEGAYYITGLCPVEARLTASEHFATGLGSYLTGYGLDQIRITADGWYETVSGVSADAVQKNRVTFVMDEAGAVLGACREVEVTGNSVIFRFVRSDWDAAGFIQECRQGFEPTFSMLQELSADICLPLTVEEAREKLGDENYDILKKTFTEMQHVLLEQSVLPAGTVWVERDVLSSAAGENAMQELRMAAYGFWICSQLGVGLWKECAAAEEAVLRSAVYRISGGTEAYAQWLLCLDKNGLPLGYVLF